MQVKICGITSARDARVALEAGADAIGLNFVPGTPRALDPEAAREISSAAVGVAVRVGVFRDAPLEQVLGLVAEKEAPESASFLETDAILERPNLTKYRSGRESFLLKPSL